MVKYNIVWNRIKLRENCVLALVQYSNCDFAPIFLTLCFCPYYFELKCPSAPALDVRQMAIE